VNGQVKGEIGRGLLVFLGIEEIDMEDDLRWISGKIVQLRIFNDEKDVMNISVKDINGDIMLVSQFTLHASTRKGNRPSYIRAAKPLYAASLYERMISQLETDLGKKIATGEFQANMQVALVNDGPVTIWIDSRNKE
jgi:D-tyrosyl-tRNA(Tyr) deacylase